MVSTNQEENIFYISSMSLLNIYKLDHHKSSFSVDIADDNKPNQLKWFSKPRNIEEKS